jgi:hypothetical protein
MYPYRRLSAPPQDLRYLSGRQLVQLSKRYNLRLTLWKRSDSLGQPVSFGRQGERSRGSPVDPHQSSSLTVQSPQP